MNLKTIKKPLIEMITDIKNDLVSIKERKKPDGFAIIKTQNGTSRYYFQKSGNIQYIKTGDEEKLRKYCQERYYRKLEQELPGQIAKLEKIQKLLNSVKDEQDIYAELPEAIRKYAVPETCSQKKMIDDFYEEGRFEEHNTYPKSEKYETERGEIVRSKSELIIANMLHSMNVPYDYERIYYLRDGSWRYPDFTILNTGTGKELLWEHLGRMDDEKYRNNNLQKIEEYQKNGVYPGENLILTFETNEKPISTAHLRALIEHCFK